MTREKEEIELIARGRHDPCVVPRGISLDDSFPLLLSHLSKTSFYYFTFYSFYNRLVTILCIANFKDSLIP